MAVYGYSVGQGSTVFATFLKDVDTAYFHLDRGLVVYGED